MQGYLFILPSFLGLLAFSLIPIIAVAVLSFFNWGLISQPTFVGVQNYRTMFGSSSFWHSLFVTFGYILLNIPIQTILRCCSRCCSTRKFRAEGFSAPSLWCRGWRRR